MTTVELYEQRWVAMATAQLILSKPDGYNFTAGQYFAVQLPDTEQPTESARDRTHTFTIANSPQDGTLSFATRMRHSAYKDGLDSLKAGARLQVSDAAGNFTLRKDSGRMPVFIAGGIGITPFRSILQDSGLRKRSQPIVLVYSNRRPQDAAFYRELERLAQEDDRFRMIATMTQPDYAELAWDGETGRIDGGLIRKAAPDIGSADFYIAGPPDMVDTMESLLKDEGATENQLISEPFAGYESSPERGSI